MVAVPRQVNPFPKSAVIALAVLFCCICVLIVAAYPQLRQLHHLPVLYIFRAVFAQVNSVPPNATAISDAELISYDVINVDSASLGILTTPFPSSSNSRLKRPRKKHRKTTKHHHHHHPTKLSDIFISVKTTKSFHKSRLHVILGTWFNLAANQTYFFTDSSDDDLHERTGGHVINTNCSSSHHRQALCCKMNVELDTFLESNNKWFCHFDDDNYVNIPSLIKHLSRYSPEKDWYLGKPSIRAPLEIPLRDGRKKNISFWFATGGAGFCISRALALKMQPIASNGKLVEIGERIRLPDDVTVGYIIEHLLGVRLKIVPQFHSHLEPLKFIKKENLANQITFSYSLRDGEEMNVVDVDPQHSLNGQKDPTRFISLHCRLHGCSQVP